MGVKARELHSVSWLDLKPVSSPDQKIKKLDKKQEVSSRLLCPSEVLSQTSHGRLCLSVAVFDL